MPFVAYGRNELLYRVPYGKAWARHVGFNMRIIRGMPMGAARGVANLMGISIDGGQLNPLVIVTSLRMLSRVMMGAVTRVMVVATGCLGVRQGR